MHTCYSPVRRSPAGEGKPSPPLPLDLHVLSLSLAFILSQDQTLRCWYIVFFLFQEVLFGLCGRPCGRRRSGSTFVGHHRYEQKIPWRREPLCFIGFSELTKVFCLVGRKLLYYSYLVYCNSFNVLFRGSLAGAAKNVAKLHALFETCKFFAIFFQLFFGSSEVEWPRRAALALAGPPSQKRVQSYTFPPFPPNIFPKKFIKTMFSSIYLTSVCNYTS